ncbi:MAG TPA: hypothetical protein VI814_11855 [Candidatus Limnocylindria bacterium]
MFPYQLVIPSIALAALVLGGVVAIAARRVRDIRPWVVVAALGVAAMPLAIILHNVVSAWVGGDEGITFVIALLVAPLCIAVGLVGTAAVLVRQRHALAVPVAIGAGGIALFALYMGFLFVVTTAVGGNPDWQSYSDALVMTVATLAAIGGALWSVVAIVRVGRPAAA